VVLALVALSYLLKPSASCAEGRLEAIEAQLDEIQTEMRTLALRGGDPGRRRPPVEDDWADPPSLRRSEAEQPPPRATPPVLPPAAWPESRGGRSEPRIDWPRERR
jgi:hypothetical protein